MTPKHTNPQEFAWISSRLFHFRKNHPGVEWANIAYRKAWWEFMQRVYGW